MEDHDALSLEKAILYIFCRHSTCCSFSKPFIAIFSNVVIDCISKKRGCENEGIEKKIGKSEVFENVKESCGFCTVVFFFDKDNAL